MRAATKQEYQSTAARWSETRRMSSGKVTTWNRCFDVYHSHCGTEVASKHQVFKRGKLVSETYMVNPAFVTTEEVR